MFRFFQRFTPAFLHKLDHQLLISRPGLWATKIHYLLFYWLMGAGLASLLTMLMPIRLNDVSSGEGSAIMLIVVSVMALIAWAVQLAHYQPWKQGEANWRFHALRDQGVYLLGLGLLVCLPFGFFSLHQYRLANTVLDAELMLDIHDLSTAQVLLENEYENLQSGYKFRHYKRYFTESGITDDMVLAIADSDYLTKRSILQRYQLLAAKYASKDLAYSLNLDDLIKTFGKGERVESQSWAVRSLTHEIEKNIDRIGLAKWPRARQLQGRNLSMLAFWAALGILLLLFVRSSWQTFLLSAVSGLGLFLLQSLVFGIGMATNILPNSEEFVVLILGLNWLVLGGVAFLGEVKSSRQQQIRMIALSLFTVLTAVAPAISKEIMMGGPDIEAIMLFILSCGITFVLWNVWLQGRMLKLVVSPKQQ